MGRLVQESYSMIGMVIEVKANCAVFMTGIQMDLMNRLFIQRYVQYACYNNCDGVNAVNNTVG